MVDIVPNVVFKTRVKDNDCTDCPNPYKWEDKSTDDYFSGNLADDFYDEESANKSLSQLPEIA